MDDGCCGSGWMLLLLQVALQMQPSGWCCCCCRSHSRCNHRDGVVVVVAGCTPDATIGMVLLLLQVALQMHHRVDVDVVVEGCTPDATIRMIDVDRTTATPTLDGMRTKKAAARVSALARFSRVSASSQARDSAPVFFEYAVQNESQNISNNGCCCCRSHSRWTSGCCCWCCCKSHS